jgi:hypothetical protein
VSLLIPAAVTSVLLLLLGVAVMLVIRALRPTRWRAAVGTPDVAGPPGPEEPEPVVLRRGAAVGWRWAGIVLGAVAAYLTMGADALGRGILLAPPVFGLCVLAGALAGEFTGRSPAGGTRRAQLRVRRTVDYLPRGLGASVAGAVLVLLALAAATTAAGSPDDQGRAGRALVCTFPEGGASHGPWPGRFYTFPALAVVLAGLVLTALALRRVVRRPQPAGVAEGDDMLRRRSAEVITAATGVLVLVPLIGIATTAGAAMSSLADVCGHPWWTVAGRGLEGLALAAFVTVAWCGARLLLPAPPARPRSAA